MIYMAIQYPSIDDVVEINKKVLTEIKAKKADRSALMPTGRLVIGKVIEDTENKEGDIFDKAVVLLSGLVQRHPFESGNRRTALAITTSFLEVNGERLNITHDINVLKGIRERYYTDMEIKEWLMGGEMRAFERK
ncbi:type II toxin-antitoxin system death-on-curing family toxin [archaeon]|nr:MAG: type II toxin-antitoxin system death-on-curing family toxin [archaeon]